MSQFIKTDDSKIAQTSRGGGALIGLLPYITSLSQKVIVLTEKRFNEEVKYGDQK